jgi:peptide/nickel transport system permease protein
MYSLTFARSLGARLGLALLTLVLISIVTFLATNVLPGDPVRAALGRAPTPAQRAAFVQQQGLDQPAVKRYVVWMGNFIRGNWGNSTITGRPVRPEVLVRIGRTAILAIGAILIAVPLGLLLGVMGAKRSGTLPDLLGSTATVFIAALPEFVIGIVLLLIVGVHLEWLPVESSALQFMPVGSGIRYYALPALTLAIVVCPYVIRVVRVNVRDNLEAGYVRGLVLRGVGGARLTWQHIVPNAMIPVVNVIALNLGQLIGGVVVVEAVFAFPGDGNLLVDAVQTKDIPTVQATVLVIGGVFVVLNFIADTVVVLLNPRLREERA